MRNRKFLLAIVGMLSFSFWLNAKDTLSYSRPSTLIGFGYSWTTCNQISDSWFGWSYWLPQNNYQGFEMNVLRYTRRPRIAIHFSARHLQIAYTHSTGPDSRSNPVWGTSPQWISTKENFNYHHLSLAPYLSVTSKGKRVKCFGEIGLELDFQLHARSEVYSTYKWFHQDTSGNYVLDSIPTRMIGHNEYGVAGQVIKPGFRGGIIVNVYKSLYVAAIFRIRIFNDFNFLPVDGLGTVRTLNFSLYYRLPPGRQ